MSDVPTRRATQSPEDWWSTSIIDMKPGAIRYRGYAIEELIGNISFPAMIWLVLRGQYLRIREGDFSAPPPR